MKRKWEGITGMQLPKKLRTSEAENNNNNVATQQRKSAASKTVLKKSKATKKTVAAPPPPIAEMPPHPDDKINVDNMIVNDLRKELRKRQLSTSGRKAELQTRLREYLAEAKQTREAEWAAKHAAVITTVVEEEEEDEDDEEEVIEETTTKIKQVKIDSGKKNVNEMDVVMEDANEETADVSMRSVSDEASMPVVQNKKSDPPAAKNVENPSVMKKKKQQLAPKSALKSSKYTSSSAGQNTPQIDDVEKQSSKQMPSSSVKEQLVPTKISDSSVDSAAISKSSKVQPSSVQKTKLTSSTASGSAFKANVGGGTASGSNSKLMEKKKVLSAASEARKARLAEMRQKVRDCLFVFVCIEYNIFIDTPSHHVCINFIQQAKPTAGASSATKPPPSHSKYAPSSSLKKMASSSTLGENKPSSIMAKMREKAAAEKNSETSSSTKAPQQPVMKSTLALSSANSIKPSQVKASQKHAMKPSPSTALKSIHDPANKPSMSQAKKTSPKKVVKPLSPMQTYEMSDREEEESDSDSDSDEEYERQRPKKQVPEWAQKSNLHRALERQFADGPNRMDPDKIFGECLTCNLEQIFDKKKSRYQRRTSSGNWSKDHVTLTEKRSYKKTMGLSGM